MGEIPDGGRAGQADLVLAGTAGLIAAAVPARRAARLDPLKAIGTQ